MSVYLNVFSNSGYILALNDFNSAKNAVAFFAEMKHYKIQNEQLIEQNNQLKKQIEVVNAKKKQYKYDYQR